MEPYQIDLIAFAVLRDLQQIQHAEKSGFTRKLMSNVRQSNRLYGKDLDLTFVHAVPATHGNVWAGPDANGVRDLSAPDALA